MVDGLRPGRVQIADLILRLRRAGVTDRRVVSAIESVARDLFVREAHHGVAYADRALPIACGQTISAPVLVGMMTLALDVADGDRVLEIGTGSGYQTAILSRLAAHVFTVERFRTLAESAAARFRDLGIDNITVRHGDGVLGWPEEAPFDRVMVTAASPEIPPALREQVVEGGVIVAPVGEEDEVQRLVRRERSADGFAERDLGGVRFVPLIPGTAARL